MLAGLLLASMGSGAKAPARGHGFRAPAARDRGAFLQPRFTLWAWPDPIPCT